MVKSKLTVIARHRGSAVRKENISSRCALASIIPRTGPTHHFDAPCHANQGSRSSASTYSQEMRPTHITHTFQWKKWHPHRNPNRTRHILRSSSTHQDLHVPPPRSWHWRLRADPLNESVLLLLELGEARGLHELRL